MFFCVSIHCIIFFALKTSIFSDEYCNVKYNFPHNYEVQSMYTCTLCVHMIPSVPYSKMMTADLWCPLYRTLLGDCNIPIETWGEMAAPDRWSISIELWVPQINKSRIGPDSVFCLPWLQLERMRQGKSETKQLLPTVYYPQGCALPMCPRGDTALTAASSFLRPPASCPTSNFMNLS